jgi:aminocarboxymuconate-semialdehyde decarboxylase
MSIDFHAHLARAQEHAPFFMQLLFDVDGYLERQKAEGISRTVLSFALDAGPGMSLTLDDVKLEHDFLADLLARYPDRFSVLGALNPFGGAEWLREAERNLGCGFTGFCFPASQHGKYLDAPEAADAFAFADGARAPIFVHPTDSPIDMEAAGDPMLRAWIGRPFDTTVSLSRVLLAGTLERYPNIRVVAAHCGGVLPMLLGRLDEVYQGMKRRPAGGMFPGGGGPPGAGGPPPGFGPPKGIMPGLGNLKPDATKTPSEAARSLYFDTASYHPVAIRAAIDAVGVDHVVFGTDHPPVHMLPQATANMIKTLGLSPAEEERVLTKNAESLLTRSPA